MARTTVMIVEDDTVVARHLENRLRRLGHAMTASVTSAEEAIGWIEKHPPAPEIVLMDIQLGGQMDGIRCAEVLRSRWGIPVVFLTGHAEEKDLKRAKLTLPFGYLLKPLGDRELRICIEMVQYASEVDRLRKLAQEAERSAHQTLREAQAELIQTEKLTAIGELAAGIAHELNQPLNNIRIIAQSINREVAENTYDNHELHDDTTEIIGLVDKMARIIDHLRTYARKPEERYRVAVDINACIANSLTLLQDQFRVLGFRVDVENSADLPSVLGDPNNLEQVFLNLMTNARDSILMRVEADGTHQGRISIRSLDHGDGTVRIDVEDNGVGVPPGMQGRIFDAFFTTKEVGKGTGLGLSIVHRILVDHGGKIVLPPPPPNGGAIFRIVIPAQPPPGVVADNTTS